MAASEIRAGKAFVELSTRDNTATGLKALENRLKDIGKKITVVGKGLSAVGIGVLAPIVAIGRGFAVMGDELGKASVRTGVTVEALSALKYAAEQSGSSLDGLETAIKGMTKFLDAARGGGKEATAAMTALGLSLSDLEGKSPDQQFKLIADRLSKVTDETGKSALAMDIFGKAGLELKPLFSNGAKGIVELENAAKRLGLVMSGDAAKAAEEFGDRMADLKAVLKASVFQVGSALAPALRSVVKFLTESATSASGFVNRNKELIGSLAPVALALGAITLAGGGTLIVAGKLIGAATTLIPIVTKLPVAIKAIGTALTYLSANPILLVVAAAGAAAIAISAMTGYTAKLNDEAERAVQTGDAQRASDTERLARLKQLSEVQNKNAQEMAESKTIIANLTSTYGDLGLSVDSTTGKINGLAGAQEILNSKMREAAILDATNQIQELKENLTELGNQKIALQISADNNIVGSIGELFANTGGTDAKAELKKTEAEITSSLNKIKAAKLRLAAIGRGDKNAITDGQTATTYSAPFELSEEIEKEQKKLAELQEAQRRALDTDLNNKVADVNDKLLEQIEIIEKLKEISKEKGDIAGIVELENQRVEAVRLAEARITQIRKENAKEKAKQAEDEEKQASEKAKRAAEKAKDDAVAREDAKAKGVKFLRGLLLDEAELTGDKETAKKLKIKIDKADFEAQLQDLFGDNLAIKTKAREIKERSDAAKEKDATKVSETIKSEGTFNSFAIRGLAGGAIGFEEQTAKAAKETAKNTKKIADQGTPKFGR